MELACFAAQQVGDAFIEDFIRWTADELPLPDCALTLTFLELAGGRVKQTAAPLGLNCAGAGGGPAGLQGSACLGQWKGVQGASGRAAALALH